MQMEWFCDLIVVRQLDNLAFNAQNTNISNMFTHINTQQFSENRKFSCKKLHQHITSYILFH